MNGITFKVYVRLEEAGILGTIRTPNELRSIYTEFIFSHDMPSE